MREYPIVVVIWEDHIAFQRATISKNIKKAIIPSVSIGFIFKETKKAIILVSDIERYSSHDDANYMVILKGSILGIKEYGKIKINKIRCEGG